VAKHGRECRISTARLPRPRAPRNHARHANALDHRDRLFGADAGRHDASVPHRRIFSGGGGSCVERRRLSARALRRDGQELVRARARGDDRSSGRLRREAHGRDLDLRRAKVPHASRVPGVRRGRASRRAGAGRLALPRTGSSDAADPSGDPGRGDEGCVSDRRSARDRGRARGEDSGPRSGARDDACGATDRDRSSRSREPHRVRSLDRGSRSPDRAHAHPLRDARPGDELSVRAWFDGDRGVVEARRDDTRILVAGVAQRKSTTVR
jgi:hypothetical protein